MDHSASREEDVGSDLESGSVVVHSNEKGSLDPGLGEKLTKILKLCDRVVKVDDSSVRSVTRPLSVNKGSPDNNVKLLMEGETIGNSTGKKMGKEKHKKGPGAKRPPRPPRCPRGFSLDAYDHKLMKELAELAMIKRERIERMKALKQKKASKISSSSSHGSLFAMLFTIIFFLVILLQGRNSGVTFLGSPQMAQRNKNGSIFMQAPLNSSSSDTSSPNSKSSTLF